MDVAGPAARIPAGSRFAVRLIIREGVCIRGLEQPLWTAQTLPNTHPSLLGHFPHLSRAADEKCVRVCVRSLATRARVRSRERSQLPSHKLSTTGHNY